MTAAVFPVHRETAGAEALLVTGIVLAALTEAMSGTLLSLGRGDIIGDIYAAPDEFAWLDIGYTVMKFAGFVASPWLMNRIEVRTLIVGAVLALGAACGAAAATADLDILIALRLVQGFAGGVVLVAAQTLLFLVFPLSRQPLMQALFAMGAVVAPATLAPALQGRLLDAGSWTWLFFGAVPLALAAAGILLMATVPRFALARLRFDGQGLLLILAALFCCTYVFSQGSRWDWFEQPRILWLTLIGAGALFAFVVQQAIKQCDRLLDVSVFGSKDFIFAFLVSFVAGAALFGSAYLIPAFAVSVLAFTPTDAGALLLPSGVLFIGALLFAAFLFQVRKFPPLATVPAGILTIMAAMWMLSGSTAQSGAGDLMPAVLLRGFGLGLLFLSINLIAFAELAPANLASGIALFNLGRQLGGLAGVAGLQTLIDHQVTANATVIGAHITAGLPAAGERLAATAGLLAAKGMDAAAAGKAAAALLTRAVAQQSTVIAFDTAFNAVALIFVFAAPVLIAARIGLLRYAKRTAAGRSGVVLRPGERERRAQLRIAQPQPAPHREAEIDAEQDMAEEWVSGAELRRHRAAE